MTIRTCRPAGPPRDESQPEIGALRRTLLGGRGLGATAQEVARNTRNRKTLGGMPTSTALELAQMHANIARGDADAIAQDVTRVRADLSGALDELTRRLVRWLAVATVLASCSLALLATRRRRRRAPAAISTRLTRRSPVSRKR